MAKIRMEKITKVMRNRFINIIIGILLLCYSVWAVEDQEGWPVVIGDAILSSPALADLDGNGKLEVIFGSYYIFYISGFF